jgi:hypothetical protein
MAAMKPGDFNFQDTQWMAHLTRLSTTKLGLRTSGILQEVNEGIDKGPGKFVKMPRYKKDSGRFDRIVSATNINKSAIGDYTEQAVWLQVAKAWDWEDIIGWVAGLDVAGELANQFSDIIAEEVQNLAYDYYAGIFGDGTTGALAAHSTGAAYTAGTITSEAVQAAKLLLGDEGSRLRRAIMHSKVMSDAVNLKLGTYDNTPQTFETGQLGNISNLSVTEDDDVPNASNIYDTIIAAPGSMYYSFRHMPEILTDKNIILAAGTNDVVLRFDVLIHVPGMSYTSSTANPSNAQLRTVSNYAMATDNHKTIPLVQLKTA